MKCFHCLGDRLVKPLLSRQYFVPAKYIIRCIYQSINQSMALSASCAGHTRTQSHAALYKINNEVVHSGMVASDYKRGSE